MIENNILKVFLVKSQHFSDYFIIEPQIKYKEEDALFMSGVNKFIASLKQYGFQQYCFSQSQHDKSVKLIPVVSCGNEVDINCKIINTLRCFFDESSIKDFGDFPSFDFSSELMTDKRFRTLSYPIKSVWINISALSQNIHTATMEFLLDHNIMSVESRMKTSKPIQSVTTICQPLIETVLIKNRKWPITYPAVKKLERNIPGCAFCNPAVINKQLVLDMGVFVIMINYQPYSGTKAHFLIVPNHIEDWSNLTEMQNNILPKILKALTLSIQVNCHTSKKDILSYLVNGVNAGQTVPGSHLHIITRPQILSYLIDIGYQMLGKSSPSLNKDQMTSIASKFKPEIFQSLLFDCPVGQLTLNFLPTMMLYAYRNQQKLAKPTKDEKNYVSKSKLSKK